MIKQRITGQYEKSSLESYIERILQKIETGKIKHVEEISFPKNLSQKMEEIIAPSAYVTEAFHDVLGLTKYPYGFSSATLRQKKIFIERPYHHQTSHTRIEKVFYRRKTLHSRIIKLLRKFLEEKEVYDKYSATFLITDPSTPSYDFIRIAKERDRDALEREIQKDKKLEELLHGKEVITFEEQFAQFLRAYEELYESSNKEAAHRFAKQLEKQQRKFIVDISEHLYRMPLPNNDILAFDVSFQKVTHKSGDALQIGILHTAVPYYHTSFLRLLEEKEGLTLKEIEKDLFLIEKDDEHYYLTPFETNYLVLIKPEKVDDFLTRKKELQFVKYYRMLLEKTQGVGKKSRPTSTESSLSLLIEKVQLLKLREGSLQPEEKKVFDHFINDWYFSLQTTREGRKEDRRFFHTLFHNSLKERIFYPFEEPHHLKGKDYITHPKSNGYQSIHMIIEKNHSLLDIHVETPLMAYYNKYGKASHDQFAAEEKALYHLMNRYDIFKGKERTRILLGFFYTLSGIMKKTYEKLLTKKPKQYADLLNKINALRWYWEAEQEFIHPVAMFAKRMLDYKYAHEDRKSYIKKPLPIKHYLTTMIDEIKTYFAHEKTLTQQERIQKINQITLYFLSQEYLKPNPKGKQYFKDSERKEILNHFVATMSDLLKEGFLQYLATTPEKASRQSLDMLVTTMLQPLKEYRSILPQEALQNLAYFSYQIGLEWMKAQGLRVLDENTYATAGYLFKNIHESLQETTSLPLQEIANLLAMNVYFSFIQETKRFIEQNKPKIKYSYFFHQALDGLADKIPQEFGYVTYADAYTNVMHHSTLFTKAVQEVNLFITPNEYKNLFSKSYKDHIIDVQKQQFMKQPKRYRNVLNKDLQQLEQQPTFLLIKDAFLQQLKNYLPFTDNL